MLIIGITGTNGAGKGTVVEILEQKHNFRHLSVREFLEESIGYLDLGLQSNGKKGTGEKYLDKDGKEIISIHERYIRPTEVDLLLADPSKAKRNLGWEPKVKFKDLARIMIDNDLELAKKELTLKR